jgi:hypothetical protein
VEQWYHRIHHSILVCTVHHRTNYVSTTNRSTPSTLSSRSISAFFNVSITAPLPSSNLPLRHRFNPGDCEIDPNRHDADDPEDLPIRFSVIPKDNSEDDTAQISGRARTAGDDAVGVRVDMRD